MKRGGHFAILMFLTVVVLTVGSTPAFGEIPSKFKPVPPCPALVAAADKYHDPIERRNAPLEDSATNALRRGSCEDVDLRTV
jgi:hypothetical protein